MHIHNIDAHEIGMIYQHHSMSTTHIMSHSQSSNVFITHSEDPMDAPHPEHEHFFIDHFWRSLARMWSTSDE